MGSDTNEDREDIAGELDAIVKILESVENGNPDVTYADTEASMELIDDVLGGDPEYQKLLPARVEASRKIMQGADEDEKAEGLSEVQNWIEQVRELID